MDTSAQDYHYLVLGNGGHGIYTFLKMVLQQKQHGNFQNGMENDMKKWLIFLLIPILFACAESRKFTLKMSQEDLANAANSRVIADNMMSRWSLNSGAIRCGMGGAFEESRLASIVTKYDKAVMDAGKWNQEDYARGCILGLEAKLGVKSLEELVKRIMELVAQYGPMF